MKELSQVLLYKNEEVVFRFAEDFGVSEQDSQEIFQETLKWLWLCAYQSEEAEAGRSQFVEVPLLGEFFALDLMWHTFILFTQDYHDFCQEYFSTFIHHIPQKRSDKDLWRSKMANAAETAKEERRKLVYSAYEVIYDLLGPETLSRWAEVFPEKFAALARPKA